MGETKEKGPGEKRGRKGEGKRKEMGGTGKERGKNGEGGRKWKERGRKGK